MKVALSAALWFALAACFGATLAPATSAADDRPPHQRRVHPRASPRERGGEAHRTQRAPRTKRARDVERPRRESRAESARAARRKARASRREEARTRRTQATRTPAASEVGRPSGEVSRAASDDEIVREGDTSVKVLRFSGLDIEGRLKSPQLVVFVERVRAEFERPTLPHRSFMPELRDTATREPLR